MMLDVRRSYGTGSLDQRNGVWYGRWHTPTGRPHRRIGAARRAGATRGLTRRQAEARLRELMMAERAACDACPTVAEAGAVLLARLEGLGRSRSHLEAVESHVRVHLGPAFADRALDRLDEHDVELAAAALRRKGLAAKSVRNVLGTLHSIFDLAVRRRWVAENPCRLLDRPAERRERPIRHLGQGEVERLLTAAPDDLWGHVERALYLAAVMTGMRQGELIGLRWSDLDWAASKIRVRRAYVRGEFGAPKSQRSARAVPLPARLLSELDSLHRSSHWNHDDDLVFANPHMGGPLDRSKVLKRFKAACARAGIRDVRFHDLRHTFGTRVAAGGNVSMRTLQEWMGHRDFRTTLIYADYQPGDREAALVDEAFAAPVARSVSQSEREHEGARA